MHLKDYGEKYIKIAEKDLMIPWKKGKIDALLKQNDIVLDIGGAGWQFYQNFLEKNLDYNLIDYNPVVVDYCTKQGMKALLCDLAHWKLPFEDGAFDLVHISHVFEHLDTDEQILIFQEMVRVLKKGWKLVLFSPTPYYFTFYDDFTHKRPCTHIQLQWLCDNFGMTVLESRYSLTHNFSSNIQNKIRHIPILRDFLTEVYLLAKKD